MKGEPIRRIYISIVLSAMLLTLAIRGHAGVIVDMKGRRVAVPQKIEKVYCASLPETNIIYALDPSLLAGWNVSPADADMRFLNRKALDLPVLGGWFGQGQTPNKETLLAVKPDIIFTSKLDRELSDKAYETMQVMKMPVVEMTLDRLSDYTDAFSSAGRVLGREKRAAELSDYSRKTLAEAAAIVAGLPDSKKVSVYYAEGPDGLNTECDTARHVELIRLAGGMNVHRCVARNPYGLEKVSLEQVLVYNPEVILLMDRGFYQKVFKDPIWRRIRAVRQKRVYLVPENPFNWFDRPPSFMRLIGLKWLLSRLYPDVNRIDIVKEARNFYRLFLGMEVSDAEMRKIVYR